MTFIFTCITTTYTFHVLFVSSVFSSIKKDLVHIQVYIEDKSIHLIEEMASYEVLTLFLTYFSYWYAEEFLLQKAFQPLHMHFTRVQVLIPISKVAHQFVSNLMQVSYIHGGNICTFGKDANIISGTSVYTSIVNVALSCLCKSISLEPKYKKVNVGEILIGSFSNLHRCIAPMANINDNNNKFKKRVPYSYTGNNMLCQYTCQTLKAQLSCVLSIG